VVCTYVPLLLPLLLLLLQGMSSRHFLRELGSRYGQEEIVHRANICLLVGSRHDDDSGDEDSDQPAHGGMSPAGLSRSTTPAMGRAAHGGDRDTAAASPPPGGADDIAARLAALQQRAEEGEPNWVAAAAAAAADEGRAAALAAAAAGGRGKHGLPTVEEDITEAGWLPK
jgi:hypothetical protein